MGFLDDLGGIGTDMLGGFGSGIVNNFLWNQQHDKLREEQLQDYQRMKQDQIELTRLQPVLERQGMEKAGLSPAALGGNFSSVNSPAMAQQTPQVQGMSNPSAADYMLKQEQAENLRADTRQKDAIAAKTLTENEKVKAELKTYNDSLRDLIVAKAQGELQMQQEDFSLKKQQQVLNDREAQEYEQRINSLKQQVEQMKLKTDMVRIDWLTYAHFKRLDMEEQSARIRELNQRIDNMKTENDLNKIIKMFKSYGIGVTTSDLEFPLAQKVAARKRYEGNEGDGLLDKSSIEAFRNVLGGISSNILSNISFSLKP